MFELGKGMKKAAPEAHAKSPVTNNVSINFMQIDSPRSSSSTATVTVFCHPPSKR